MWTIALVGGLAFAQSSPSDLTDASLSDLLQMDVDEWRGQEGGPLVVVDYTYLRSTFDGYRSGAQSVSNDEALFDPTSGAARTDDNFPVLPTRIVQQAHQLGLAYRFVPRVSAHVGVPFILQATDHISIVEGYDAFTIASSGIGDTVVTGSVVVVAAAPLSLTATGGLSVPTGSIDEQGDTPREPGDQQLPYTMQIGSGTWDLPLGVTAAGSSEGPPLTWQADLSGRVRLGRNARDYRLGNRVRGTATVGARVTDWLEPHLIGSTVWWGPITGRDDELVVEGDFVYPAPVTNPDLFGGVKASASAGVALGIPGADGRLANQQLTIRASVPVHQSLNGPQPEEDWTLSTGLVLAY